MGTLQPLGEKNSCCCAEGEANPLLQIIRTSVVTVERNRTRFEEGVQGIWISCVKQCCLKVCAHFLTKMATELTNQLWVSWPSIFLKKMQEQQSIQESQKGQGTEREVHMFQRYNPQLTACFSKYMKDKSNLYLPFKIVNLLMQAAYRYLEPIFYLNMYNISRYLFTAA